MLLLLLLLWHTAGLLISFQQQSTLILLRSVTYSTQITQFLPSQVPILAQHLFSHTIWIRHHDTHTHTHTHTLRTLRFVAAVYRCLATKLKVFTEILQVQFKGHRIQYVPIHYQPQLMSIATFLHTPRTRYESKPLW